jgi:tRNA-Thr(GGU) m(6)t(6)A37 methyltransferase TsaA
MNEVRDQVRYRPIGVIRSPFNEPGRAPIQPPGARGVRGRVELRADLAEALAGISGFSHLILLYHCHLAGPFKSQVRPFLDAQPHGALATRAPARPNPIGLSVVRLVAVEGSVLIVEDVDVLDGTPLLDVKPFVPAFDAPSGPVRIGWLEGKAERASAATGDDRFTAP